MTTRKCGTYTVGNFKGGVGKTKIVVMLGFDNAIVRKRRTLIVDMDPQANASTAIATTFGINNIEKTITTGIKNGDLSTCITHVHEYLDLIACDTSFRSFPKLVQQIKNEKDQMLVLKKLLDPLKEKYDEILIDVPPTISEFSDNAMGASDYSIIAFQTVPESKEGVDKYVKYQQFMVERYNIDLQIIDIIPCLVEPGETIDEELLQEVKDQYGTTVSSRVINYQKRLKKYSKTGIQLKQYQNGNYDRWDFIAHNIFIQILSELDRRREYLETIV